MSIQDMLGPLPYVAQQSMLDAALPPNLHNYWKADFLVDLSDAAINTILDHVSRIPSPHSLVLLFTVNGVARRVPVGATAFPHRVARLPAWDLRDLGPARASRREHRVDPPVLERGAALCQWARLCERALG